MSFTNPQPPADQLHDMASLMEGAVTVTLNTQRKHDEVSTYATDYDARLLQDLLLDTLINASATIALLRRMEHKLRYPRSFVSDEQVQTP